MAKKSLSIKIIISVKNKKGEHMRKNPTQWAIMAIMLLGLPLSGILLSGRPIAPYLEFPPLTRYVEHAAFSWAAFTIFAGIDLLLLFLIINLMVHGRHKRSISTAARHHFPLWGWAGLLIMLVGWLLAWTRFAWFAPWQGHTFCLPWIGYIILINALCVQRSGHSLLTDVPKRFPLLIGASAVFWWFFEYLNRFVQNWYYTGVDHFSALSYTLFASLSFATVLPAVLGTYRLLLTYPLFDSGLNQMLSLRNPFPRALAWGVLALSGAGLAGLGIWPNEFFSLLWVSPLLIISALQFLSGREILFTRLGHGDWRPLLAAALAGLICGFFWELWNVGSLARWHYAVPYVQRFHLFAMPMLGYGGYLPFGLECLVVGSMVVGPQHLFPGEDASAAGEYHRCCK